MAGGPYLCPSSLTGVLPIPPPPLSVKMTCSCTCVYLSFSPHDLLPGNDNEVDEDGIDDVLVAFFLTFEDQGLTAMSSRK